MPKIHSTNYYNTLILVSEDTKATEATIPPVKDGKITIANLHFNMIYEAAYQHSSDDVIFAAFAQKQALDKTSLKAEREQFFSKGQACMRTSALAKNYGWGIHHNAEGKIALLAMESQAYYDLEKDENIVKIKAMKRAK